MGGNINKMVDKEATSAQEDFERDLIKSLKVNERTNPYKDLYKPETNSKLNTSKGEESIKQTNTIINENNNSSTNPPQDIPTEPKTEVEKTTEEAKMNEQVLQSGLVKQEGFELGKWSDLFQAERLNKLIGQVRLLFTTTNDFAYNFEDFLTNDGMVMTFGTLRNALLLQEQLKVKRPNWKSTLLY